VLGLAPCDDDEPDAGSGGLIWGVEDGPGCLNQGWFNNCVAVGRSEGFLKRIYHTNESVHTLNLFFFSCC
jgi:hypothetical protein